MSQETAGRKQKATLWAVAGRDREGRPTVSAGVEILVRWEKATEEIISDEALSLVASDVLMTDQEIAEGSIIWKGALADVPDPPTDLREVISNEEIPDVKGRSYQRTVVLGKYANALPTIV